MAQLIEKDIVGIGADRDIRLGDIRDPSAVSDQISYGYILRFMLSVVAAERRMRHDVRYIRIQEYIFKNDIADFARYKVVRP